MKECPDCKEQVKDDARKCRYCQYVFPDGASKKVDPPDTVLLSTVPASEKANFITFSFDRRIVQLGSLTLSAVTVLIVAGAVLYGIDLNNARNALHEAEKNLANANELIGKTELWLERIGGGIKEGDNLKNALSAIKSNTANLQNLDGRLKNLEGKPGYGGSDLSSATKAVPTVVTAWGEKSKDSALRIDKKKNSKKTPTEQESEEEAQPDSDNKLTKVANLKKTASPNADGIKLLRDSIILRRTATPAPNKGSGTSDRQWYTVSYTVHIDDSILPGNLKANVVIEKVVYEWDKNWFSNPVTVMRNRSENFRDSRRVWGITDVKVEVFVSGLGAANPLSRDIPTSNETEDYRFSDSTN